MNTKELKILLADDDRDDCIFFKEALEELPISARLTTVNDGEELMELLNNKNNTLPDVLFLDINMPRKNGIECLTEIKESRSLKELPVIMFSTSDSQSTMHMLFKLGAHVYVRKPGDLTQLMQVIQHALPMAAEKLHSKTHLKYILNA